MCLSWAAAISEWAKTWINRRCQTAYLVAVDAVGESVCAVRFPDDVITMRSETAFKVRTIA
ncbi:MAG: hypothetical protein QOD75_335, partial [Blastocatellia bacterium]|nr:hypothetical protein [Blastocatellia bacterium]